MGESKRPLTLGPVEAVRYNDYGVVLGWSQPVLDRDGAKVGTASHETEAGRAARIDAAFEHASSQLDFELLNRVLASTGTRATTEGGPDGR